MTRGTEFSPLLSSLAFLNVKAELVIGLLILAMVVVLFVLHRRFLKAQIARCIDARGGRVVSIRWAPFGAGFFGEDNDTIFDVVYLDEDGSTHGTTCKVSTFGAVYWLDESQAPRSRASGTPTEPPARARAGEGETCPACGATVPAGAERCRACGIAFVETA